MPKVGESINTVQTRKNPENIDVQGGGGDIGRDISGENIDINTESIMTEKEAAERPKRKTKP
jgi:hypothetical protein